MSHEDKLIAAPPVPGTDQLVPADEAPHIDEGLTKKELDELWIDIGGEG